MRKCLLLLLLAGLAGQAQAASTNAEAAAEFETLASDNYKAVSAFLAEPLGKGLAFASGNQGFSPVSAKKLLGFNLGFGLGVSSTNIDKSGAKASASQNGVDISSMVNDLPASLPIPLGQVNAHVGLPKLLFFESNDLGLRLQALNLASSEINLALTGFGAEFRGNVFEEGLVSPVTFTLSLGLDSLRTEIRSASKAESYSATYSGATLAGTTQTLFDVDSQITSVNLKGVVSRKLLFIKPYAGAALNVLSGDTTVRMAQKGSLSVTGLGGGTATTASVIEGKSTKPAPSLEARLGAGFELHIFFFYLAFGGEYGVVSGGGAGYGQLGFQFR